MIKVSYLVLVESDAIEMLRIRSKYDALYLCFLRVRLLVFARSLLRCRNTVDATVMLFNVMFIK